MRQHLIYLLFLSIFLISHAWAKGDMPTLPIMHDLQADGHISQSKKIPVMIMFVADNCPFCITAKQDFIHPMIKSGDYDDKVIIRFIEIDGTDTMIDFQGNQITMEEFSKRQKINFTPYVKFFNAEGKELVKPIIGISNKDYYGVFLDDAIESAIEKLRK
jgi:thioredoxin-related protein